MTWAVRDGRDVERLNPRMRCISQVRLTSQHDLVPARSYRLLYHLLDRVPGARDTMQLFRFEF